jgi:transposase-like protein
MGLSIRKSATICQVSVKTSFYMRHRLLDAVRNFQGERGKQVKKRGISNEQACMATNIY